MKHNLSYMIALGVGVGVAIGVATHNMGVWIAIGAAVGVALSNIGKNDCACDATVGKTNPPETK